MYTVSGRGSSRNRSVRTAHWGRTPGQCWGPDLRRKKYLGQDTNILELIHIFQHIIKIQGYILMCQLVPVSSRFWHCLNWTGVLPETSLSVGAQNCLLQLRGTGSRAGQSLYTDIRNPLSCRDSSSQILRDWRTSKGPLYRKSHPSLSKPAGVKPNLS